MKVKNKKRHYVVVEVTPGLKKQLQALARTERRKLAQFVRLMMEQIVQRALQLPIPDCSRRADVRGK